MLKNLLITLSFLAMLTTSSQAQNLTYEVSMPKPQTHYFEVSLTYDGEMSKKGYLDFKMATWTPGSYLLREFSKSVEKVSAADQSGKILEIKKLSKNTWRVFAKKVKSLKFSYRVYAFEHSVRTSFLDIAHGYINGTSVFVFIDGKQDLAATVKIIPHKTFKKITTALKPTSDIWTRKANNYDHLADSPIEIGNHEVWEFTAAGVPHKVVMFGDNNADKNKVITDLTKIAETGTTIFGEHPCDQYIYFIHNMSYGGGGLEHAFGTSLIVSRFNYGSESGYNSFLGLASHEYFHLWNVKRVRPEALGPFDYEHENYTTMLWVVEGFTSYFDDIVLLRAGLKEGDDYLTLVQNNINNIEGQQGNKVQPVSEASLDAWVKAYRPNENSRNTTISYYSKGAVIATMLDLIIIHNTKAEKRLDDVMKYLYNEYYKKKGRGYTDAEFKAVVEKIAGVKLDDFFKDYINGTKTIDYNKYLNYAGLAVDILSPTDLKLGISTKNEDGRLTISYVESGSPAYESGLNVKDEIIAVDGYRVNDSVSHFLKGKKVGERLTFLITRDTQIKEVIVELQMPNSKYYQLKNVDTISDTQKKVLRKWLGE